MIQINTVFTQSVAGLGKSALTLSLHKDSNTVSALSISLPTLLTITYSNIYMHKKNLNLE